MMDWSGDGRGNELKQQSVEEMKAVMMGLVKSQKKIAEKRNNPPVSKLNKKGVTP